ncbi:hypothetical protein Btru_066232 [Bulinus truncatus]|nr:hypothetical protein Btru_066232 [Bulinus truncatus]
MKVSTVAGHDFVLPIATYIHTQVQPHRLVGHPLVTWSRGLYPNTNEALLLLQMDEFHHEKNQDSLSH